MRLVRCAVFVLSVAVAAAQPYKPTDAEYGAIRSKLGEISKHLDGLRNADPELLADVEIYRKAAQYILRFPDEFYRDKYVADTVAALDRGLARARELEAGKPAWPQQKGRLVRAYRSGVDGSVQPYGLIIPESYDGKTPARLDVVLHGRGATLNEVSFLAAHDGAQPVPDDQDFLQLDVFGRTNNAYRWAGETDVFGAIESVRRRYNVDRRRIVLRGFSMGGAGTWHIGLHYPDMWAATEAGAGFTETRRYAKLSDLPPYQDAPLGIYDAVDYALNAFNLPMAGYGSEDDPQLQASVNIREQIAREGLRLPDLRALFLVGPRVGHRFAPESKKESERFIRANLPQRTPDRIRFVTCTTRYNRCFWVTVEGLEHHYQRAEVDAQRSGGAATITTKNIARLSVADAERVTLDGRTFSGPRVFAKRNGRWTPAAPPPEWPPHKEHGLQGPIDDAFLDSFLCVRPTGEPLSPLAHQAAVRALDRFTQEFAKWMRGDVRVKDDTAVTGSDMAENNLILFGDPASNRVLARVLPKLPVLRWTRDTILFQRQTLSAADHLPVLIYPNPLNPKRYVVINSGHTFHDPEFRGTNALLFPRLGDYAVLKLKKLDSGEIVSEVALAGLFNEDWN